ncbi:MAG: 3-hydroxyacyl-CoA dehydrogenase [Pseudomonas fluorescens]|nr:MAG: 3-hydroxyacyl-CoA dehydrogenase [Pseudomonas fluorescens]
MQPIRKVAVIGAGVMGAGIAAHVANAGIPVVLLDVMPDGAAKAIEKLKKSNPAALMHPANAKLITPGSTAKDLKLVADCDWIIEAIIEKLDVKQALYRQLAALKHRNAVVSSNTSTLPLEVLVDGLPLDFRKHFLIAHFFNPPRYMRLLELVTGPQTLPDVATRVREFADHMLGKTVVDCADTPGFIANRIGTYWLHASVVKALDHNVSVEAADAIMGKPMGIPKTGVFGLMDLVGLDLMPHILHSLRGALPADDAFVKLGEAPHLLSKMIADGYTGRKGKGGFYKLDEKKKKHVIDLQSGHYALASKPKVAAVIAAKKGGLRALLSHESREGKYAWEVMGGTFAYAASLVGEIAGDIATIDEAIRLGYNWKYGPFELIDKLGPAWFAEKLRAEGKPVPKILVLAKDRKLYRVRDGRKEFLTLNGDYMPLVRAPGVILLEDIKREKERLFGNMSASVWDIGDRVACLELHSKMNSFNPLVLRVIRKATKELPERGYKALVIYNEGSNFSVGANILMLLVTSKLRLWPLIDWILKDGQSTFKGLKYATFPVVAAPHGMALGGGCEIVLHAHAVEAHAETYIGLVEGGVGIIPGWGGCKELLGRAIKYGTQKGPMPPVIRAFETIAMAKVSKSAAEARDLLFLRPDDGIVMNRDRLLAAAKARALSMVKGFEPPAPHSYVLPGPSGLAALKLALHDFFKKGMATPHDMIVGAALAQALSGGDTDMTEVLGEDAMLKLERKGLISLAKTSGTRARIAHMLKKNKPLRN